MKGFSRTLPGPGWQRDWGTGVMVSGESSSAHCEGAKGADSSEKLRKQLGKTNLKDVNHKEMMFTSATCAGLIIERWRILTQPCADAADPLAHPYGLGSQASAGPAPGPAQQDATGWQMPSSQQVPKMPSLGRRQPSHPPTGCPCKPRGQGRLLLPRGVLWAVWGGACMTWQIAATGSGHAAA